LPFAPLAKRQASFIAASSTLVPFTGTRTFLILLLSIVFKVAVELCCPNEYSFQYYSAICKILQSLFYKEDFSRYLASEVV
jgi:hypothetical protein